jgi:hypothetical protein
MQELLDPAERRMSPELARFFAEWQFSQEATSRIAELGEKANDGALTAEEDEELRSFVEIGDRLAALKLRAQAFLRGSAA